MSLFRRAGALIAKVVSSPADPAAEAGALQLYAKTISGIVQLFTRASNGTIQQISGLANAYLDIAQTFTKAQAVATVALSNASSPVPVNASLSNTFTLTLNNNLQIGSPTNLVDGGTYVFRIKQDATGGRVLTFTSVWKFIGGVDPTITAAANALDIITATSDGTNLFCSYVQDVK